MICDPFIECFQSHLCDRNVQVLENASCVIVMFSIQDAFDIAFAYHRDKIKKHLCKKLLAYRGSGDRIVMILQKTKRNKFS